MDSIKAVCHCQELSENNKVIAIKHLPFAFFEKWSGFTYLGFGLLCLMTGGAWLIGVLAYHFDDILNPKYHCNLCDAVVSKIQFRL